MHRKIIKLIFIGKIVIKWIADCCWCSIEDSVYDVEGDHCSIGREHILEIRDLINR